MTDAVHANGSYIFCQLWALGRAANVEHLHEENPAFDYVAPSPIPLSRNPNVPRELTVPEIKEYAELYAQAAKNAIDAGFDGVEIHGANGYLPDQFIKEVSNQRTDEYGGSIENRSRFVLETVQAVVDAIGAERTGIRFSPWGTYQGEQNQCVRYRHLLIQDTDMKVEDPVPQFSYIIKELKERYPDFGYIHVVEPIDSGPEYAGISSDPLRKIWQPKPFISAGSHTRESAIETVEKNGGLVAFGRLFIANVCHSGFFS